MIKMELTKERLTIIVVSIIAVVILGSYLFLYRPIINKLKLAGRDCKAMETELFQARDTIATLKSTAQKGLIPKEEISPAIDELTKEGKLRGLNFTSIKPGQIEKPQQALYKILPVEMEVESAYKELATFLGSLRELEKSLITLRSFSIVSDKTVPTKLKTKLIVNIHISNAE